MANVGKRKMSIVFIAFIALLPILPEYFRIGSYPVLVFLPLLPLMALGFGKRKISVPRIFKKILLPLMLLAVVSYGIHGELSSIMFSLGPPQTSSPELMHSTFFSIKSCGSLACASIRRRISDVVLLMITFHPAG